jgi:glycerol kinase
MSNIVVALDCGTHAARTLAFDVATGAAVTCATRDIPLSFPRPGWVEVDPEILASASIGVVRSAFDWADRQGHVVVALGIANMRETAFAWRRSSSAPLYPGVMWMSQQSQPIVERWHDAGLDTMIRERTGLTNDPFFFGSKVGWLLENVPEVAAAAKADDLAVGTVDSWLVHRLTGGAEHRTDVSNASRTQVLNLHTATWDAVLADALGIPLGCLPEVTPSMSHFGVTHPAVCGREVPITGVVADQQGSLLGHGCEERGTAKATFGTSGVVALNTGSETPQRPGMVTSVAWTDGNRPAVYEVEGSAFHSGYTMTWLSERTGHPVRLDADIDVAAAPARDRVYVLPSFSQLGAPRWPRGRGAAITGLAMDTTTTDIMRAGVEAMAFQAYDLFAAIGTAAQGTPEVNVDGGGASSDYLCRLFADLLERDVVRPDTRELTSVGAAKAALRGAGHEAEVFFGQDRSASERFRPGTAHGYARQGYLRWTELVEAVLQ